MTRNAQAGGVLLATDTVSDAMRLLTASGAPGFLVMDEDRPFGVVTEARLRASSASPDRTVGEIMDYEVVAVDHGDDIDTTMRSFEQAGWTSLLRRRPFADDERPCRTATRRQTLSA